ncbi:hypothetical protein PUNSTDRAFT_105917 [Punctularia strigosozonata HHB-11173 SS5]|uniref:uncharacterized protein n=1 Tax=Punctularia strigosozonata (strain HHB-11173) TaxID=741275 RepID=UPI0004417F8E|nr:uncharacterized protein PUNSTDRAFT_105917 [Punctularia strigosozonata HHB-11173 SS5]EIN06751.1 hypothetical protein PUNSTDRAFT_105917 [Punctularia strigosozonata HHB-11173 SS5]
MSLRYVQHILYSVAITSISIHLLNTRKSAEATRSQLRAQISVLETIAQRLRSGEDVSDAEISRLQRLLRANEVDALESTSTSDKDEIGWREVLLGRKRREAERLKTEELDRRDMERVEASIRAEG